KKGIQLVCQSTENQNNFRRAKDGEVVLQIINSRKRGHWVLATNLNCPPGEVILIDTLDGDECVNDGEVKMHISALFKEGPEGNIKVRRLPVQAQGQCEGDSNTCGPFVCAMGYSLILGEDVTKITYIEQRLRETLCRILRAGMLQPFPMT